MGFQRRFRAEGLEFRVLGLGFRVISEVQFTKKAPPFYVTIIIKRILQTPDQRTARPKDPKIRIPTNIPIKRRGLYTRRNLLHSGFLSKTLI